MPSIMIDTNASTPPNPDPAPNKRYASSPTWQRSTLARLSDQASSATNLVGLVRDQVWIRSESKPGHRRSAGATPAKGCASLLDSCTG